MTAVRRICVFCGSSPGVRAQYADMARAIGHGLTARAIGVVYGGGNVGLMGVLADAALERGGHVIGVIPESLRVLEVAHDGLPDLRVVSSMHTRKELMADLADAFIALPGGLGTFEELLEIFTWHQLGLHAKPIGVLNVAGYYDPLLALLDHAVSERFLRSEQRQLLIVDTDPLSLIDRLCAFVPPAAQAKWIDRDQR